MKSATLVLSMLASASGMITCEHLKIAFKDSGCCGSPAKMVPAPSWCGGGNGEVMCADMRAEYKKHKCCGNPHDEVKLPFCAHNPFTFASGLDDAVSASPENYAVAAEIPGVARLIVMHMKPGEKDDEHDHPVHYLYVVKGGKLQLTPPPGQTSGSADVDMVAGAAPILPGGAHTVENIGAEDVKILFVEPMFGLNASTQPAVWTTPFEASPEYYTLLAEDDHWMVGEVKMQVGQQDSVHHHMDHFIYVMAGDQITIFPAGDETNANPVDIAPGAAMAAPISAGDIFANHVVKNTGTTPVHLIFFEKKR